ncbi:cupin [Halomonas sp. HP20-15]|uniref:1,2-dihydroxy-3-keto-5-methylthiopentene dioxygenase n=1 Tax=Halomonas sp. HP20-15 TaxID=3085901 RepID=UPI0029810946|nr:cupin [Halomonas sp. HP20-15]MDW5377586.1 cupin [Halomonas sp. HP20-15]
MSFLRVYHEADGQQPLLATRDDARISGELEAHGIRFEHWPLRHALGPAADQETVLAAYGEELALLRQQTDFAIAEVIGLTPDHPDSAALRERFLEEHHNSDEEVRFFVRGEGIFYLHLAERVYVVGCVAGDLMTIPAGTRHWFDMGPAPDFTAIRLYSDHRDRVASMTGSRIASRFPRFEALSEERAA